MGAASPASDPDEGVPMLDTLFHRSQGLFDQLEALHRTLSGTLGPNGGPDAIRSVAAGSFPAINVGRTAGTVEVHAYAPGLDPAAIDVMVERGVLRISGERRPPAVEGDVQAYAAERPHGRFLRAITLPDVIDTRCVQARYRVGVLRVSIGLQQSAQPQRIAVQ
jgi:HSP20 family protein